MIRLILALAITTLIACSNPAGSNGATESSDTLYIVSTYPVRYIQHRAGDSAGGINCSVQQKHLDKTNGFALTKMVERVEGGGWAVTAFPQTEDNKYISGILEILTAPRNSAYYFNLEDTSWITIGLDDVRDSMVVKGVWE